MARTIETAGVVGLGTMGSGIAEVLARSGVKVIGVEVDAAAMERARTHVEQSTARALTGGKLDDDARADLLGRISYTTALTDLADADLVIEAVPESVDLKAEVFAQLD